MDQDICKIYLKVKGQDQLQLGDSILASSGIFTLLDEQLADYRPVQNNYLRWIADASGKFHLGYPCVIIVQVIFELKDIFNVFR